MQAPNYSTDFPLTSSFSVNPEQVIARYPGLNANLEQAEKNKLHRHYRCAVLFFLFRTRPGFAIGNPTEYAIHAVGKETIRNIKPIKRRATLSVVNSENCQPTNPRFEEIFNCYAEGFMEPDFFEAALHMMKGDAMVLRYLISKGAPPPKPGKGHPIFRVNHNKTFVVERKCHG